MHSDCGWKALASLLADRRWYALWFIYGGRVACLLVSGPWRLRRLAGMGP
jgi:hypothetical protein